MKPINFPQVNRVLQKPPDMTDEECGPLPVCSDGLQCVSCWKASVADRLRFLLWGKLWLGVVLGEIQPPVWLSCSKTVFKSPPPTPAKSKKE